jgi:hypothetical protein
MITPLTATEGVMCEINELLNRVAFNPVCLTRALRCHGAEPLLGGSRSSCPRALHEYGNKTKQSLAGRQMRVGPYAAALLAECLLWVEERNAVVQRSSLLSADQQTS